MNDEKPAAFRYSLVDLRTWLGGPTLQKGSSYVSRVGQLQIEADAISGMVNEMDDQVWRVHAQFNDGLRPHMTCTCPTSFACKHVAAVLLKAMQMREQAPVINPVVLKWIDDVRRSQLAAPRKSNPRRDELFYILEWSSSSRRAEVSFLKGRLDADGQPGERADRWENVERALLQVPSFIDDNDIDALRQIWLQRPRTWAWGSIPLHGKALSSILRAMLATGRLFFDRHQRYIPLRVGPSCKAELVWQAMDEHWTVARLRTGNDQHLIIPGDEPWYVDTDEGLLGPLECNLPAPVMTRLFELPPLTAQDRQVLAAAWQELAPQLPSPAATSGLRTIECAPQPVLELRTVQVWSLRRHRQYDYGYDRDYDMALPGFAYEGHRFDASDSREFLAQPNGETLRIKRDFSSEARWLRQLERVGLRKVRPDWLQARHGAQLPEGWGLESEAHWQAFMHEAVPELRAAGWQVRFDGDFRHFQRDIDAWYADVSDEGNGWFDVELGIEVEGQRVALAPLLCQLFRQEPRWLQAQALDAIADGEFLQLPLPDGGKVRVEAGRIKPLARTLIDLFDSDSSSERLRLSALDAGRLAALDDPARWQFRGPDSVRQLVQRLAAAGGVREVPVPDGLQLQLRPYQRQGLAWLQYLREHELGGILADDMGLGKTAQTLAHLLIEKHGGRLDRPALVVLPTSLVFNWQREAQRIAPALRVLALHGKDRAAGFERISQFDVVLTTYSLLWRDEAVLLAQPWHLLILDEAQSIKNAASRAGNVLRRLQARHRLCLTGTPLENHLGELWSLFDFALPGFLGDSRSFASRWRTPIEKQGDLLRRQVLAQRVRPFILRRRKEDVAQELPAKTTVVRSVELTGSQRDLYETVRSTVDEGVQKAIAAQGFKRSQIVILDALLKLRQVCCDPRLVKGGDGGRQAGAKLQLLADMLPELIQEGRRILIFSQFTAMLDLIGEQVQQLGLDYVRLDGQTQQREEVVNRFQHGEVPVFLLSLKAGGVGLNLTAADTVIHFDPWWNPAAESQATDRAHRIGQDKPVFVYKLVVAGSIEERIVALQERKAELAAGILESNVQATTHFEHEDLLALLAPLE